MILDKDFYGWNGFVCHDEAKAGLPRPPLTVWRCKTCGGNSARLTTIISSEGKDFFVGETDGDFASRRWADGFSWFVLNVECVSCGTRVERLVDYETM